MILEKILINKVKDKLRDLTPSTNDLPKAVLIFGCGAPEGISGAVAQRFASEGFKVYVTGRTPEKLSATVETIEDQGGKAAYILVDASEPSQIESAFEQIAQDGFAIDLVVHNVGTNIPSSFLDITSSKLERQWRADCFSGFYVGQQAIKHMQPNKQGTIIFTGASASLRGKAGFAGFSSAKAGLRSLAQSMAREFGPKGIHVAHVIIDGLVDGDRLRSNLPQLLDKLGDQGAMNPTDIAEAYWQLHRQHRTTWTHELDLRPFKEAW